MVDYGSDIGGGREDAMLTLFVAKSHARDADVKKAADSFKGLPAKVFHVEHDDINRVPLFTPWYAVIYDDEVIDEKLQAALVPFMVQVKADALVCFKSDRTKAPRLFRSHLRLQPKSLLPANPGVKFEYVLNGMFKRQDHVENRVR